MDVSRYILQHYKEAWGVPSARGTDPSSNMAGASPTPMETDSTGAEEEDAPDGAADSGTAAIGWKGKGKQRAGKARRNRVAPGTQASPVILLLITS